METFDMAGKLTFRTKLLDIEAAGRFARCLRANARFCDVEIATSRRAKSDVKYFVTYLPANPIRQGAMVDRQQEARIQRAEEQEFTFCADTDHDFCHCHSHSSGEVYEVTLQNCSCPDYEFRCKVNGLACKHMMALAYAVRRGEVEAFRLIPATHAVTESVNLCETCAPQYGLGTEDAPTALVACDDCGREPVAARGKFDAQRFNELFGDTNQDWLR